MIGLLAPPEPAPAGELDWLMGGPWASFGLVLALALIVLFVSRLLGQRAARPGLRGGGRGRPDFDLRVAKLESLPVVTIADAERGPVHVVGTVCDAEGGMGTLLYRNRYRGQRATAIAAELVLVRDDTGLIGLEKLEDARVIAPRETVGDHEVVSLLLGDRVQVLGDLLRFEQPTPIGERREPLVGMLGTLGPIQIRVLERSPSAAEQRPAAVGSSEPATTIDPHPDHDTSETPSP
ncbi:hypothetical protein ACNOYE_15490 [Nannocystaceae bacterium ST9]